MIQGRNTLRLEVDTHSNHTTGPLPATLANIPGLLHLGGLPSKCGLPCRDWDLTLQWGNRDQADWLMQGPRPCSLFYQFSQPPLYFQRRQLLSQSPLPIEDA